MPPRADERGLIQIPFQDFSGGLYERGSDRECAPNGLLECTDCMPLLGGGLRAAWAWQEESIAGLPTGKVHVSGFQVEQRSRSVFDRMRVALVLASTGNLAGVTEVWIQEGGGTTGWTDVKAWSSGRTHVVTHIYPTVFQSFFPSTASNLSSPWYYNIAGGATTGGGVWKMNFLGATASTDVYTAQTVLYVGSHQDRLIYVLAASTAATTAIVGNTLVFTDPGSDATPPTSNALTVTRHRPTPIVYLDESFPTDLFALKAGDGAYSIQGDIGGGPLVRDLQTWHIPEQISWGTRLPVGLAYLTEHEGVWSWVGGSQTIHLSPQFVGSPMSTLVLGTTMTTVAPLSGFDPARGKMRFLGDLEFGGRWLFTPKGYIFDAEGQFWFRSTLPAGSTVAYPFWSFNRLRARMYGAGSVPGLPGGGGGLKIISASTDESTMIRSGTFSATLPIIDMAERNVELRRIEIFGQGFGQGGTWQLEITNEQGQTETTDLATAQARACSARFNVKTQGDHLKVRVLSEGATDASSSTGKSEAPMIERLVIYLRPRQTRSA